MKVVRIIRWYFTQRKYSDYFITHMGLEKRITKSSRRFKAHIDKPSLQLIYFTSKTNCIGAVYYERYSVIKNTLYSNFFKIKYVDSLSRGVL